MEIPEASEEAIDALRRLVDHLNALEPISADEAERRREAVAQHITERILAGQTWGDATFWPKELPLDNDGFKAAWARLKNDLTFLTDTVDKFFNNYLKTGDFVPPGYAWRIAVVLRRAKRKDLERAFLEAYTRHLPDRISVRGQAIANRLSRLQRT